MTNRTLRGALALTVALLTMAQLGAPAFAQTTAGTSDNLVTTKTAWAVFVEGEPKECWGVSKPKETVNTRDGKEVSVKRSDILLFVTFRPGQAVGETSFAGGYPFAEDDAKLLAAMQKGAEATLTARSAKGTQTKDTFSLSGFTAAMTEAEGQCK